MTEEEARTWLADNLNVSRETLMQLDAFASALREENERQNLVSRATLEAIFSRHIVDSAQLIPLAKGASGGPWLDLGTGAGFPGLIVAALTDRSVILVESRRLRCEWLARAAEILGVSDRVTIHCSPLERVSSFEAAVISARAFAPLPKLLKLASRFATVDSLWLLPKGRNAKAEVEALPKHQRGMFHVEQSLTDAESSILVGRGK